MYYRHARPVREQRTSDQDQREGHLARLRVDPNIHRDHVLPRIIIFFIIIIIIIIIIVIVIIIIRMLIPAATVVWYNAMIHNSTSRKLLERNAMRQHCFVSLSITTNEIGRVANR